MKRTFSLIAFSLLLQAAVMAQPAGDPEAVVSGQITLPDNSTVSGSIKDNIRKKGELVMMNSGKKIKYKAGEINSAQVGGVNYITWNYTFYEILWQGTNLTLLRKANEPAGVQYSGSDAVVVSSEGNVDDLFVRKKGEASLMLLTKKTAKEVLGKLCSSCAGGVDASTFDAEAVKKAVAGCDACK
ncbi:MAG: hypothetical protein JNN00_17055 [Chitinophagaceae bacterium]|nr:hypothetical protein [Chitinophagaceae bacterium]